ncbi:MAG: ABC transporter permease [Deltaproteobacteria bacterium]|nr:ABC transporter permease [Deltaproteobacteria bacterium]
MNILDISLGRLAAGYLLLAFPLGIIIWLRLPMLGQTLGALARMTLQLLFVGFYLQFIFDLDNFWITGGWIAIMLAVADVSIVRGARLRLKRAAPGLFLALLLGTVIPLLVFVVLILPGAAAFKAQYLIPIGGMILGNCLRADVIGLSHFYEALDKNESVYRLALAQGAGPGEALRPFVGDACRAALIPTVATMATIGLVSLPGMMTGVILGGGNPMMAVRYQTAIMIAIFSGTALTVILAIYLTAWRNFTAFGTLDRGIFRE